MWFSTAHFSVSELQAASDPWPAELDATVRRTMALVEWLRVLVGAPIDLTSLYRSPARNASVGGVARSQHKKGEAADLKIRGVPHDAVIQKVRDAVARGDAPEFGQMIFYTDTGHIHVSLARTDGRANYEMLWADKEAGTYTLIDRLKSVARTVATHPATPMMLLLGIAVLWILFNFGRGTRA